MMNRDARNGDILMDRGSRVKEKWSVGRYWVDDKQAMVSFENTYKFLWGGLYAQ